MVVMPIKSLIKVERNIVGGTYSYNEAISNLM